MTRDSLAFALSGTFFGLLVGWIIGTQQIAAPAPAAAPPAAVASAPASSPAEPAPAPVDASRVTALEQQAKAEPSNVQVRIELANAYFDARRYADAIPWYEAALKLNPQNVNVSTDLGVAYYSTNQVDRALAQFDRSIAIDPRHLKTLLNQGIVRAFGKSDLEGAAESWRKVVAIAPSSEEGRQAQQGLDGIQSAHGDGAAGAPGAGAKQP